MASSAYPRVFADLLKLLERFPGVGPKSAQRLAFFMWQAPEEYVTNLSSYLLRLKQEVHACRQCFHLTDNSDLCSICEDSLRNKRTVCVVERPVDVLSLEAMGTYKGVYHVLGGLVNPLAHVGPDDLKIAELVSRVQSLLSAETAPCEIILAVSPTMEGEATSLYIKKKLEQFGDKVVVSRIGSGLPIGADLEFADMATLNQAMNGRRVW